MKVAVNILKELVNKIATDQVRVAVVTFSDVATIEFNFLESIQEGVDIVAKLEGTTLPNTGGFTQIVTAFETVRDNLLISGPQTTVHVKSY